MAVFNLGSINADYFYEVPHLPKPGETLAALGSYRGLGGKGANQSIAAAQAGATVYHIGAVGPDGAWACRRLADFGVNTDHIATLDIPTAHAIINVDPQGENAIVIYSSANVAQDKARITTALKTAKSGDICILQNETNLVEQTAQLARDMGLYVVYSAAPFAADKVTAILPYIDVLVVNEVEAVQLSKALNAPIGAVPVDAVLITKGSAGSEYLSKGETVQAPAFQVRAVDTTGAGDTYLGFFAAGLDGGKPVRDAMRDGAAAAAIQVTRKGTGEAIPSTLEVNLFIENSTH